MLDNLNRASQWMDLKMNMEKTKNMSNGHVVPTRVTVGISTLDIVDENIYLKQTVRIGRFNFKKKVEGRIQLSWTVLGKLRGVFSSKNLSVWRQKFKSSEFYQ